MSNDYDGKEIRRQLSSEGFHWGKWAIGIILILSLVGCVLGLATGAIGTASKVASTPGKVIEKVTNVENVLNSYNQFFEVNNAYQSRLQDIKNYTDLLNNEKDEDQQRMYRQNITAMRSVCINMANKYNSSAINKTTSWFKDSNLPDSLNVDNCSKDL
jgi:uncharacterized membrane protein